MKYYSDLEKIVHAAHMQDIWTAGGLAYKKFQESEAFHDESICPCITDVENNGILEWLKEITLKLRFGEHSGGHKLEDKIDNKPGDKYHFQQDHFHNWKDGKTLPRLQFGEHNLGDDEEPLPNIKSVEAWKEWKDDILDFNLNVDKFGKMLGMYM